MTFKEFLEQYYVVDFIWEIFKGIAPTIIAIITITVNARISKKRAKKDRNDNQIKELQMMAIELSQYIVNTGKYMLDAIQHSGDDEKTTELIEAFKDSNDKMLINGRQLSMYSNILAETLKKPEMSFSETFQALSEYSYDVLDVHEWYNDMASKTPIEQFDDLCDEAQKKLINVTEKIERKIVEYCKGLNK